MKIIITESQFEQIIPNSVRRRLSEISDVLYAMLNNTNIGEEAEEYPEDDYVDYVIEILLPEVISEIDWSDVAEYEEIFKKLVGDKIRKFWKEQNQDSLNESDSDKLTYSNQYADLFFEYCLKNINKITEKLISEAYYEFMINDLNVVITIDDLINSNGQRTIGEYDDETLTLRIGLFDYFKKFLLPIDDLGELSNDEKEIIIGGVKNILVTANNEFARNIQESIRQVIQHEIVHHYANVKYGKKYSMSTAKLELIKSEIKNTEKQIGYYVNMPHEIDANFISSLGRLIDNHGKNYGDFQIFREMFLDYFPRFDELSSNNKKKINRRLYKFFETLFGKFWKEQNQDSLNESEDEGIDRESLYVIMDDIVDLTYGGFNITEKEGYVTIYRKGQMLSDNSKIAHKNVWGMLWLKDVNFVKNLTKYFSFDTQKESDNLVMDYLRDRYGINAREVEDVSKFSNY